MGGRAVVVVGGAVVGSRWRGDPPTLTQLGVVAEDEMLGGLAVEGVLAPAPLLQVLGVGVGGLGGRAVEGEGGGGLAAVEGEGGVGGRGGRRGHLVKPSLVAGPLEGVMLVHQGEGWAWLLHGGCRERGLGGHVEAGGWGGGSRGQGGRRRRLLRGWGLLGVRGRRHMAVLGMQGLQLGGTLGGQGQGQGQRVGGVGGGGGGGGG